MEKELAEFLEGLPEKTREIAEKYPPTKCYRSKENPKFHYKIVSYSDPNVNGKVELRLIHGSDSSLPGIQTFGQDPNQLVECNCENWKMATEEQTEKTLKRIIDYKHKHHN